MLKKPKTQEEEMMLLTQFLTLSALSKVFSEQWVQPSPINKNLEETRKME